MTRTHSKENMKKYFEVGKDLKAKDVLQLLIFDGLSGKSKFNEEQKKELTEIYMDLVRKEGEGNGL